MGNGRTHSENMNVLLVDDHAIVRQGVVLVLKNLFMNVTVQEASTLEEAEALISVQAFGLVFLDILLSKGNSLELLKKVKSKHPQSRVLIFSGLSDTQYAIRYIQAGADGYLNKQSEEGEIKDAVHTVLNGRLYMTDKVKDTLAHMALNKQLSNPLDALSNRELQVAELFSQGHGNIEIATTLGLKESTVSTYKTRVFDKLSVNNVVALASLFKSYGHD